MHLVNKYLFAKLLLFGSISSAQRSKLFTHLKENLRTMGVYCFAFSLGMWHKWILQAHKYQLWDVF